MTQWPRCAGHLDRSLFAPAVLYPVTAEMQLWTAEQFGPVVPIAPGPLSTVEGGETGGISQPVVWGNQSSVLTLNHRYSWLLAISHHKLIHSGATWREAQCVDPVVSPPLRPLLTASSSQLSGCGSSSNQLESNLGWRGGLRENRSWQSFFWLMSTLFPLFLFLIFLVMQFGASLALLLKSVSGCRVATLELTHQGCHLVSRHPFLPPARRMASKTGELAFTIGWDSPIQIHCQQLYVRFLIFMVCVWPIVGWNTFG